MYNASKNGEKQHFVPSANVYIHFILPINFLFKIKKNNLQKINEKHLFSIN